MRLIQRIEEFAPILAEIERDAKDDADLRSRLDEIRLADAGFGALSALDPFSRRYADEVLRQFAALRGGQPYDIRNEGLPINTEFELAWGFPYGTQSASVIGGFLVAYGHLIRTLSLAPAARVLEVGAGTGGLTRHLARAGYRVTAVEINASNAALVRQMTEGWPAAPEVIVQDVGAFVEQVEPASFDAVVFFESFHHLHDHAALLRNMRALLAPCGRIAFGAEPILADGDPVLPYPWGIRLDGQSLRAIVKWGWLELGFSQGYFDALLERTGLVQAHLPIAGSPWGDLRIAWRKEDKAAAIVAPTVPDEPAPERQSALGRLISTAVARIKMRNK